MKHPVKQFRDFHPHHAKLPQEMNLQLNRIQVLGKKEFPSNWQAQQNYENLTKSDYQAEIEKRKIIFVFLVYRAVMEGMISTVL